MFRANLAAIAVTTLISLFVSESASAAWPDDAFPVKNHDFGTVAVAAKTEFRFPVYNPYTQPMHIQTIRASCGCTTPIVESEYIQPGQTGSILARFNTGTFRGKKGATLTVVVDKPFFSEVRLRVDGYIRSDMVFHPGALDFGKLSQGERTTKATKILYAGRSTWQIVDVRSNVEWLLPTVKMTSKNGGKINYELSVAVREDAPTGVFQNEIVVTTNDSKRPRVPFRVTGSVESPLQISPQAIAFGSVKPGQKVQKTLVLKGTQPFTIDSITCAGWDVTYPNLALAKSVHVVPATFMATDADGPQKVAIEIKTAGAESVTAKAILTADVRAQ